MAIIGGPWLKKPEEPATDLFQCDDVGANPDDTVYCYNIHEFNLEFYNPEANTFSGVIVPKDLTWNNEKGAYYPGYSSFETTCAACLGYREAAAQNIIDQILSNQLVLKNWFLFQSDPVIRDIPPGFLESVAFLGDDGFVVVTNENKLREQLRFMLADFLYDFLPMCDVNPPALYRYCRYVRETKEFLDCGQCESNELRYLRTGLLEPPMPPDLPAARSTYYVITTSARILSEIFDEDEGDQFFCESCSNWMVMCVQANDAGTDFQIIFGPIDYENFIVTDEGLRARLPSGLPIGPVLPAKIFKKYADAKKFYEDQLRRPKRKKFINIGGLCTETNICELCFEEGTQFNDDFGMFIDVMDEVIEKRLYDSIEECKEKVEDPEPSTSSSSDDFISISTSSQSNVF